MSSAHLPVVRVIVLAFGEEPYLHDAVRSALESEGVDVRVTVVDNGCTSDAVTDLPEDDRLTVTRPDRNLGFAGGVNFGARDVEEEFVSFLNSDAAYGPDALARLVAVADRPDVGLASPSLRLAHSPELLNSAGNPIHISGLSWAGAYGEPAEAHAEERDVASATGAGVTLRTAFWRDELGGFDDTFFAYQEDVDLSWRTWMLGRRVVYVPDADVLHHYEFGRNNLKMYLMERNRAIVVRSLFSPRLLAATFFPRVAMELAVIAVSVREGWFPQKLRAMRWVVGNGRYLRTRRAQWQAKRVTDDRELVRLLTSQFTPAMIGMPSLVTVFNAIMTTYWKIVRPLV